MMSIDQVLQKLKDGEDVQLCDIFSAVSLEGKAGQEKRGAALSKWLSSGEDVEVKLEQIRVLLASINTNINDVEAIITALYAVANVASADSLNRLNVEILGRPLNARQLSATASTQNTQLVATTRRVTMRAVGADIRYSIGVGAQTANASTSHFIAAGERLDLRVQPNSQIAVIRNLAATANGTLELTELA